MCLGCNHGYLWVKPKVPRSSIAGRPNSDAAFSAPQNGIVTRREKQQKKLALADKKMSRKMCNCVVWRWWLNA